MKSDSGSIRIDPGVSYVQNQWHKRARNWLRAFLLLSLTALLSGNAFAARFWIQEQTSGGLSIDVYDLSNAAQDLTMTLYNPDGTLQGTYNFSLRAFENKTFEFPIGANLGSCGEGAKCGIGLVNTVEGRSGSTTGYGVVLSSDTDELFGVIGQFDKRESGVGGGGKQTYNPQRDLYTDTWWGMYNYPDSDVVQQDYFHIFNGNSISTSFTIRAYDTSGTLICTAPYAWAAFETRKFFPHHLKPSSRWYPRFPIPQW